MNALAVTVPTDYNPRLDAGFKTAWLNVLIAARGTWLHPTDLWVCDDAWTRSLIRQVAYEAVVAARRCGLEIAGDRAEGYCFIRYELPRYLHLHEQADDREAAAETGQLTLAESEGVVSTP